MASMPYVIEQSSSGERSVDIFSRLLSDRIIVLSDEVNDQTASLVVAQLLFLESQDSTKDICSVRRSSTMKSRCFSHPFASLRYIVMVPLRPEILPSRPFATRLSPLNSLRWFLFLMEKAIEIHLSKIVELLYHISRGM